MTSTSTTSTPPPRPPNTNNNINNLTSTFRNNFQKWPVCSSLAILMIFLHVFLTTFDVVEIKSVSLRPVKILKRHEYYRLITNALFHEKGSPIHLGLNLMTLYAFGRGLEQKFSLVSSSSLQRRHAFLKMTIWSILITSCLYLIGATVISQLPSSNTKSWYKKGTKGFSGVLYHYMTIRCHGGSGMKALDFLFDGMPKIKIPTRYYPWATMLLWHLLEPDNEKGTLMHICGILLGILHVEGYLNFILPEIPKESEKTKNDHEEPPTTTTTKEKERKVVETPTKSPDPASVRDARLKRFN